MQISLQYRHTHFEIANESMHGRQVRVPFEFDWYNIQKILSVRRAWYELSLATAWQYAQREASAKILTHSRIFTRTIEADRIRQNKSPQETKSEIRSKLSTAGLLPRQEARAIQHGGDERSREGLSLRYSHRAEGSVNRNRKQNCKGLPGLWGGHQSSHHDLTVPLQGREPVGTRRVPGRMADARKRPGLFPVQRVSLRVLPSTGVLRKTNTKSIHKHITISHGALVLRPLNSIAEFVSSIPPVASGIGTNPILIFGTLIRITIGVATATATAAAVVVVAAAAAVAARARSRTTAGTMVLAISLAVIGVFVGAAFVVVAAQRLVGRHIYLLRKRELVREFQVMNLRDYDLNRSISNLNSNSSSSSNFVERYDGDEGGESGDGEIGFRDKDGDGRLWYPPPSPPVMPLEDVEYLKNLGLADR